MSVCAILTTLVWLSSVLENEGTKLNYTDFDGDEMNIHVPQTEEARTEAISLMGVKVWV